MFVRGTLLKKLTKRINVFRWFVIAHKRSAGNGLLTAHKKKLGGGWGNKYQKTFDCVNNIERRFFFELNVEISLI